MAKASKIDARQEAQLLPHTTKLKRDERQPNVSRAYANIKGQQLGTDTGPQLRNGTRANIIFYLTEQLAHILGTDPVNR